MKYKVTPAIALVLLLVACAQNKKELKRQPLREKETETQLSEPAKPSGTYSGLAASPNGSLAFADGTSSGALAAANGNPEPKFIRTADLKFKVKNVVNTTSQIEDITRQMGGFVASTELKSQVDNTTTVAVSADSSLESSYYAVSNSLILRVPDVRLDSTLKVLATLVDFLDYRTIKSDDVRLQLLANQLTQDRAKEHNERVKTAIDTRGKKLVETTGAEESVTGYQATADEAKLSNLKLEEQVNFSTVTLQIYERPTVRHTLIANNKDIRPYQAGLATRISDAFRTGWDVFEIILVGLVQLWWLVLLLLAAWLLAAKFLPKYKLHRPD